MKENFENQLTKKPKEEKIINGHPMSFWQNVGNGPEVKKTYLEKLWKSYNFLGQPPKEGSPAEARLKEICLHYTRYLTNEKLSSMPGSEPARRELHNQIALMVIGELRTDMDTTRAEEIADFACVFATGQHIKELESE